MKNLIAITVLFIFTLLIAPRTAFAQGAEKPAEPTAKPAAEPEKAKTELAKPTTELAKPTTEPVKTVEAPIVSPETEPPVAVAKKGFNHRFNLNIDVFGGKYDSKGDATVTFANAGQYPTLTSGEKLPFNIDGARTAGFQMGGGYRFNNWLSLNMNAIVLASKSESNITTSKGSTHNVKMDTGFIYLSPLTWTGYPVDWLYLTAGLGAIVEGHKVTTDINNIGSFESGSAGTGVNLGAGVEFPLGSMFTLRGGLTVISGTTVSQEKKLNEGQASEVTAKWEDRKISTVLLNFGTKFYF